LDFGLLKVTLAINLGTSLVISARVELEELAKIELGGLEDLDLADEDITERVDGLASLLDLSSNKFRDELVDQLLQVARRGLSSHDLEHLLADLTDLGSLSVGGLLDLAGTLLGEGDGEEAEQVTVGCLDVNVGLDDRLGGLWPRAKERKKRRWSGLRTIDDTQTQPPPLSLSVASAGIRTPLLSVMLNGQLFHNRIPSIESCYRDIVNIPATCEPWSGAYPRSCPCRGSW